MQAESLIKRCPALAGRLTLLAETDSTNRVVKGLLAAGAHGPVVIADAQTGGRGRAGRSFASPPGTGLYLTLGLPPLTDPAAPLTALVGLCVCAAIERVCGGRAELKWVNDVLINRKKVCGILCEAGAGGIAVGIGVNVSTPAAFFAEAGLPHASSLRGEGCAGAGREALAAELVREVDAMAAGLGSAQALAAALDDYRGRLVTLGREVRVVAADGSERTGFARDIDARANLIVDFGGRTETVNFGDVSVRGLYGYV